MQVSTTLRPLLIQLARLNEQIERQENIEKYEGTVWGCNDALPYANSEDAPKIRAIRDRATRQLAIFADKSLTLAEAKAIAFA